MMRMHIDARVHKGPSYTEVFALNCDVSDWLYRYAGRVRFLGNGLCLCFGHGHGHIAERLADEGYLIETY